MLLAIAAACAAGLPQAATAQAAETVIVELAPTVVPERPALHRAIRVAARRGEAREAGRLARLLAERAREAHAAVCQRLRVAGGRVVADLVLLDAVVVELPAAACAELRHEPATFAGQPVAVYGCADRDAHLRTVTSSVFTHADEVQADPRHRGRGVAIAFLDSGVAFDYRGQGRPHRAFQGPAPVGERILGAFDFANTPPAANDATGHGTAVAAVALANDWHAAGPPGSDQGFAPEAGLVSYRITQAGSGRTNDAILAAVFNQLLFDAFDYGIRVVNCSFSGSPDPDHPSQRALDQLVLLTDVLVVTSAGNLANAPQPSAESQSNANGLAVGAVQDAQRRVYPLSSPGPLYGDGRLWPDLVAMGIVASAQFDDEGSSTVFAGTSFAAPQVAGTAAMLRGADPGLSSSDVRALILHSTEDVAAANPNHDRNKYGLGMLRTDLVFQAWQHDRLLRDQLVRGVVEERSYDLDAVPGQRYAVTLAWQRLDVFQRDWDDLDLLVYEPGGALRVVSETPRNLYERVLFTPRVAGRHRVSVVGRTLRTPQPNPIPFSLVIGEARGGGEQPGSLLEFGSGCAGRAPDPSVSVLMPPLVAFGFGNDSTSLPFAEQPMRYQQAFDHAWFAGAVPFDVHHIALRRRVSESNTQSFRVDLDLRLGYTAQPAGNLSLDFDANVPASALTTVRSGWIDFHGNGVRHQRLFDWDWLLTLDRPFRVDTAPGRNLILDVDVRAIDRPPAAVPVRFDAIFDAAYSRVYRRAGSSLMLSDRTNLVLSLVDGRLLPMVPRQQPIGDARPGRTLSLVLRDARPCAPCALVHGRSREAFAGWPLPIDLGAAGAPGCMLYTDWALPVPLHVGENGQLRVDYQLPAEPGLSSAVFHTQLLLLDPGANALGLAVSSANRIVIGG